MKLFEDNSNKPIKPTDPNFGTGVDITKSGDELISEERAEQVLKHNRPIVYDLKNNMHGELVSVAEYLINGNDDIIPHSWDIGLIMRMAAKTKQQRLVIAGALIAAEIDRLNLLAQIDEANKND